MRNLIRSSWSICSMVAALLVSDSAGVVNGALPGSPVARLSAQTATTHQAEERLFLEARRALNRGEYDQAAASFQKLRDEYAHGRLIPDSYYWEAFGRYRQGDLPEALLLLDVAWAYDEVRYGSRLREDVRDLRLRVRRQLAEMGDPRAAEDVLRESEAVLLADTTRLGTPVTQARNLLRLTRVLEDMRWRADSARAVQSTMLRTDSLSRDYALRRARVDSLAAVTGREAYLANLVRQQRSAVGALTDLLEQADTAGLVTNLATLTSTLGRTTSALGDFTADPQAFGSVRIWPPPQVPEGCENASVQQEAFTALIRLVGDPTRSVHEMLARQDECSAHLRHQAVSWLARQGTEEAETTLIEAATNHADTETRKWAVMGLAEFGTPRSAISLAHLLTESSDDGIRGAAISALRYNPNEQATDALAAFSSNERESEELRKQAVAALGLRIAPDPDLLMDIFNDVGSDRIRTSLMGVLGRRAQAGEAAFANWLFEQALNAESTLDVRKAALEAWSRASAVDLERLAESYEQLEEPDLRERIFYALYRQARSDTDTAPAVVDGMIELARAESDPEVRERAVYWLGRTGSERAAEFLMELLRKPPDGPSSPCSVQ